MSLTQVEIGAPEKEILRQRGSQLRIKLLSEMFVKMNAEMAKVIGARATGGIASRALYPLGIYFGRSIMQELGTTTRGAKAFAEVFGALADAFGMKFTIQMERDKVVIKTTYCPYGSLVLKETGNQKDALALCELINQMTMGLAHGVDPSLQFSMKKSIVCGDPHCLLVVSIEESPSEPRDVSSSHGPMVEEARVLSSSRKEELVATILIASIGAIGSEMMKHIGRSPAMGIMGRACYSSGFERGKEMAELFSISNRDFASGCKIIMIHHEIMGCPYKIVDCHDEVFEIETQRCYSPRDAVDLLEPSAKEFLLEVCHQHARGLVHSVLGTDFEIFILQGGSSVALARPYRCVLRRKGGRP